MQTEVRTEGKNPALMSALSRFGQFKPESERIVRAPKIEMNPILEAMRKIWTECGAPDAFNQYSTHGDMLIRIGKLEYSAKDVEVFSLALPESQGEERFGAKAGLFLSALINNCKESEFVIHTNHLAAPIEHIGFGNTKEIIIDGDVGNHAGDAMEGGSIIVIGSAGISVGIGMNNGTITVEGKSGDEAGYGMKGGVLILKGHTGNLCGVHMEGGEIHIESRYVSISTGNMYGGKIFHKGK